MVCFSFYFLQSSCVAFLYFLPHLLILSSFFVLCISFSLPLSVSLIVYPFLYFSISSSDDAFLLSSSFCHLLLFIHSSISPFLALMMHFFSFPLSVSLIVYPFLYFSISSSDDAFLLSSSFCLSYCLSIPLFLHF